MRKNTIGKYAQVYRKVFPMWDYIRKLCIILLVTYQTRRWHWIGETWWGGRAEVVWWALRPRAVVLLSFRGQHSSVPATTTTLCCNMRNINDDGEFWWCHLFRLYLNRSFCGCWICAIPVLEHKIHQSKQLAKSTNLNCILNVKFISRNGTSPQNILSKVTLQFHIHES